MNGDNNTDIELTIRNEQVILRNELQELKKCQLQYFLISITTTGAILGLSSSFQPQNGDSDSLLFLAPLLVILPCWWTFFDKATTISRLTGYMRVFIEDQLAKKTKVYIGYENALLIFRDKEKDKWEKWKKLSRAEKKIKRKENKPSERSRNIIRHLYWKINFITYFSLSLSCCLMFCYKSSNFIYSDPLKCAIFIIMVIFVLLSLIGTLIILRRLLYGKYSYSSFGIFWKNHVLPSPSFAITPPLPIIKPDSKQKKFKKNKIR